MKKNKKSIIFEDAAIKRLLQDMDQESINKIKKWLAYEKILSEEEKTLTFGNATIKKLMKIVSIERVINKKKFNNWFSYEYKLSDEENIFLDNLIEENQLFLTHYNEITLTTKFIAPILNKVKFRSKNVKDWYGYRMECELNNYILSGEPDFSIATGIDEPETPYFFLQEYKRFENKKGNPEYQVLAAMLTAITLNNTNEIKGAYVVGRIWNFLILEKLKTGNYEYCVSKSFDSLEFEHLKQIYINLQAVKFLYCK